LPGEGPLDVEEIEPPYKGQDLNAVFNDKSGASLAASPDVNQTAGIVTVTLKNYDLKSGNWLLFFFYPTTNNKVASGNVIAISAQVWENEGGLFEAEISLKELEGKGFKTNTPFTLTYINEGKDVYGHGTFGTALLVSRDNDDDKIIEYNGCNAGYLSIPLLTIAVFFVRKKR
jgi:hypothetical protein